MQRNTLRERTLTIGLTLMVALSAAFLAAPRNAYADTLIAPAGGFLEAFWADTAGETGVLSILWGGPNTSAGVPRVSNVAVQLDFSDGNGNSARLAGVGVDWAFAILPGGLGVHQIFFVLFDFTGNPTLFSGVYVTNEAFTAAVGLGDAHTFGSPNWVRWFFEFPI